MRNLTAFAENVERYDGWYDRHTELFAAELAAIKRLTPKFRRGLEIGVGTGRFAAALGICDGIDPEPAMLAKAAERGIACVQGTAEHLPYVPASFDLILMTTTICFLDDIHQAFAEIRRVLTPRGCLIAAFIDKNSQLGLEYQKRAESGASPFYSDAKFVSYGEIGAALVNAGFEIAETRQTLFPDEKSSFQILPGHGQGAFVVMKAVK